ncbi:dimethylaniline monooxygenase [N-oxide-forming] 2-like [Hemibagrus wyckioides]|uniref:dimethylaniline monooxygenase [N-oxide-forming] 2-like n=1 Tax=Hemibagrus wyckioides TaxID=337641 RepID=UPI00266D5658|nr:dimethylaniline monooxygenase [N-oxide-forming] 2-like [Hemibagrus wyckioides]
MSEGVWVVGRMSTGGLPWDMNRVTHLNTLFLQLFPQALLSWAVERSYNQKFNHRLYGLQPCHRRSSLITAALKMDYITYLDSIAEEIGVHPNLLWLFLMDPGLGLVPAHRTSLG